MTNKANRNDWATPQELFDVLDAEFHFTVDAAASAENAKCARYWTEADDALSIIWTGETVFCNPPFGRSDGNKVHGLPTWINKARGEHRDDVKGTTCVILTPCDPSTGWFKVAHAFADQVRVLTPRPKYVPPEGIKASSAPSSTAVFIFTNKKIHGDKIILWDWKKAVADLAAKREVEG